MKKTGSYLWAITHQSPSWCDLQRDFSEFYFKMHFVWISAYFFNKATLFFICFLIIWTACAVPWEHQPVTSASCVGGLLAILCPCLWRAQSVEALHCGNYSRIWSVVAAAQWFPLFLASVHCSFNSISMLSFGLNHRMRQRHYAATCSTAALCIFHWFSFLYE